MRHARLIPTLIFVLSAANPYAQSAAHGSLGKKVAPGIEALFSQSSPGGCVWRFRNADPTRTLASMRFTYTYDAAPLARVPMSTATNQSGEDVLTDSLAPFEESRSDNAYRAPAPCATVNIHVTAAQWI